MRTFWNDIADTAFLFFFDIEKYGDLSIVWIKVILRWHPYKINTSF